MLPKASTSANSMSAATKLYGENQVGVYSPSDKKRSGQTITKAERSENKVRFSPSRPSLSSQAASKGSSTSRNESQSRNRSVSQRRPTNKETAELPGSKASLEEDIRSTSSSRSFNRSLSTDRFVTIQTDSPVTQMSLFASSDSTVDTQSLTSVTDLNSSIGSQFSDFAPSTSYSKDQALRANGTQTGGSQSSQGIKESSASVKTKEPRKSLKMANSRSSTVVDLHSPHATNCTKAVQTIVKSAVVCKAIKDKENTKSRRTTSCNSSHNDAAARSRLPHQSIGRTEELDHGRSRKGERLTYDRQRIYEGSIKGEAPEQNTSVSSTTNISKQQRRTPSNVRCCKASSTNFSSKPPTEVKEKPRSVLNPHGGGNSGLSIGSATSNSLCSFSRATSAKMLQEPSSPDKESLRTDSAKVPMSPNCPDKEPPCAGSCMNCKSHQTVISVEIRSVSRSSTSMSATDNRNMTNKTPRPSSSLSTVKPRCAKSAGPRMSKINTHSAACKKEVSASCSLFV